jgi:hypothetical protein
LIGITFQGQLGNQMFQYAVARIASERLRCGLVIGTRGGWRRRLWNAFTNEINFEIFRVFPLPFSRLSRPLGILEAISDRTCAALHRAAFPHSFEPKLIFEGAFEGNEAYDPRIWDIRGGTWLRGYFQSPLYFAGWESEIRRWYQPPSDTASRVNAALSTLPENPTDMLAVHVRLGDYLTVSSSYGSSETGVTLPRAFYERALSRFPKKVPIALFSDEPDLATAVLSRRPAWVSRGSDHAVDLFSMASFKRMVISNSSFSWWAAWLNLQPEKEVVAPEFHIGWRHRHWYPADIQVGQWTYV